MLDWLPASLTAATTFKSQKILFKARALGSNLLQPKGDYVHPTFQYYNASIETRPPQLHNFLCFSAVLPPLTFYGPLYRHRNDPHHRNDPRNRNDPQSPPK